MPPDAPTVRPARCAFRLSARHLSHPCKTNPKRRRATRAATRLPPYSRLRLRFPTPATENAGTLSEPPQAGPQGGAHGGPSSPRSPEPERSSSRCAGHIAASCPGLLATPNLSEARRRRASRRATSAVFPNLGLNLLTGNAGPSAERPQRSEIENPCATIPTLPLRQYKHRLRTNVSRTVTGGPSYPWILE